MNKQKSEKLDEVNKEEEINSLIKTNYLSLEEQATLNISLDNIMDKAGYNSFSFKIIFIQILILIVDGIQMSLFSSLIIPLQKLFQIPDWKFQIISSILFVGIAIGSLLTGVFSRNWSRPFLINSFLALIFFCTVALAFSLNFILFGLFRFIIGIILGLTIPMSINLCTECLPQKNRAFVLTGIWTGFSIGVVLFQIIMLCVMPQLEISALKSTILYTSIIPLVVFIISLFFLEDSPRNLILRNRDEDSFKIIEKISNKTLENSEKISVVKSVKDGLNNELSNEFNEIFNKKYIYLSVILSLIWVFNSINTYGPVLISNLTLKSLEKETISSNYQILLNQLLINIIELPSQLIGGFLCEIKFLGRKKSSLIASFLAFIFTILFILFPKTYTFLFGVSQAFLQIVFNIIITYSCEIYPTKIRDYATGFLFFTTRIGGIISQFLFLYINNLGIWVPYYVSLGFILVNIFFIIMLPYETYGKPLDIDYEIEKQSK
jgi:putative MFS transporter